MFLHWITYYIDCQSTKQVQKQHIYITSIYIYMHIFKYKTSNLFFLHPSTKTICGSWEGTLAFQSAQILRVSCLEIKEKLLGKMWHNCQRQYQSRHSAGERVQASGHQRARLITLVMITGDITAISAQTPIKYEWLSSRRGSRRLWKEFGSETIFWVWF